MNYYDIDFDEDTSKWELDVPWKQDGVAIDVWSYLQCRPGQKDPSPKLSIYREGYRPEFNLAGGFCVPMVSPRIGALLEGLAGSDIERIPCTVEDGSPWEIINVLSCVDAIDHRKSDIIYHPTTYRSTPPEPEKAGRPSSVYRLVLDPQKIAGQQLFRLKDWHSPLIASESVVNALIAAGVTRGVEYLEIPTDSDKPGRMRLQTRQGLTPWSVEERNAWLASAHRPTPD